MSYTITENLEEIYVDIEQTEIYERLEENRTKSFKSLFERLLDFDKNVELDFKKVEVVDSLFIGQLIILHKRLASKDHQLKILNLNELLKDLFERLRLDYLGLKI